LRFAFTADEKSLDLSEFLRRKLVNSTNVQAVPIFSATNEARKEKMFEAAHSPGAVAIGAILTRPII
jgi:hypothetical protein